MDQMRVVLIGDERAEIECASIRYEHATWRAVRRAAGNVQHEMTAMALVTLGRVDLATWQRVRLGSWTHLIWEEAAQELLVGEIEGPILSALDGFRFTLKEVAPST